MAQQNGCSLNINFNQLQTSFNLSPTTRNAELDQMINLDMFALYDLFGVKANVFMFQDNGGPDARALPIISDTRLPDGTILLGANLLIDEFRNSATGLGFAISGVIAHEMAHILQFSKNCRLPVMQMELQADFLAGYYLSVRSDIMRGKGLPVFTFAPEAFRTFFSKGDYNFNSPQHHGTREQRLAAIVAGYNCDLTDIDEVYEAAKEFVTQPGVGYINNKNDTNRLNNSDAKTSNISILKKIITLFQEGKFNSIIGSQIKDEEPFTEREGSIVGDCKSYYSKLVFSEVAQTKISICIGGTISENSNPRISYDCDVVGIFNDDEKLSYRKFQEWTEIINAATNLEHTERTSEYKRSTTITRSWRAIGSGKPIIIRLSLRKSKTMQESTVSISVYERS
ncbi:MAG: hypothetical protein J0I84_01070 [Terrimonas sp.]|nr:hypothetical protein [Terrimonas sp.]